jgi:hypothetical protein
MWGLHTDPPDAAAMAGIVANELERMGWMLVHRDADLASQPAADLDVEAVKGSLKASKTVQSLTHRLGTFNEAWWDRFAGEVAAAYRDAKGTP